MPDLPHRRRPQRPSWTEPIAQRLTPAIKVMVIASALLYALFVFVTEARPAMMAHLALGPGLFRGELWQPLTSLFVHFDLLGFVFNLIGLWFVGAYIERTQGTGRFLTLFLAAGVLSNLAIAAVAHTGAYRSGDVRDGCSFAVLALFVAFGRIFGRAPAQLLPGLVLQARYLALMFVGWGVVVGLVRRDWPGLAATAVASAVGYLLGAGGSLRELIDGIRARRLRRRYRVIEGGAGRRRGPKYLN